MATKRVSGKWAKCPVSNALRHAHRFGPACEMTGATISVFLCDLSPNAPCFLQISTSFSSGKFGPSVREISGIDARVPLDHGIWTGVASVEGHRPTYDVDNFSQIPSRSSVEQDAKARQSAEALIQLRPSLLELFDGALERSFPMSRVIRNCALQSELHFQP